MTQTAPTILAPPKTQTTPRPTIFSRVHRLAHNMFGLDYRSLALLRISIALCLLWVIFARASSMRIFYTDAGVLPRTTFFRYTDDASAFSLYHANGSVPFVATLFTIQAIAGLMMLVGYRTRLATIVSYILLLSLQNRHPVLNYGADNVLRVCFFWMMFLPLGRHFSIDRATRANPNPPTHSYLGIAGFAYFLQFASIYTFGAFMKTGDVWHVSHDAVAYALAVDAYSRPLGTWLGHFPAITTALTYSTLYIEFFGPFLFILPFFSRTARLLAFLFFTGLQFGFGVCMYLGYFGPVMVAISCVFLPDTFWDRFAIPLSRRIAAKFAAFREAPALAFLRTRCHQWLHRQQTRNALRTHIPRLIRLPFALARDAALIILLIGVFLLNLATPPGQPYLPDNLTLQWKDTTLLNINRHFLLSTSSANTLATLGLFQFWDMFAPFPQTIDGWFVVEGTMQNGDTINLLTGESPASFDKPADVPASYRNGLWMSYLISFWYDQSDPQAFTYYLGREWNQHHTGDQRLKSVTLDRMIQYIQPGEGGPTKTPVSYDRIGVSYF